MPPKVLAKPPPDRAQAGVLPVNAAARAAPSKAAARLKLEIRRLPPSLTLSEFEETLGEDWKLGKGKVDWREYCQGKLKSPGKLPEQSRCYLHLVREDLVKEFEKRFLEVVFHDKAGTHKNPELKHLPPMLGFAPNQRVPVQGKTRLDNRQGTIDTDPEYQAFLEAETQPLSKPSAIDAPHAEEKDGKEIVKSTPLIDDLREKKANKAKAAASKADKKGHARTDSKDADIKEAAPKLDAKKVEQAAKEAAKALNKQAASKQPLPQAAQQKAASPARSKRPPQSPKPAPAALAAAHATAKSPAPTGPGNPAPIRNPNQRPPRGNAEGIKKMLQKDLGIRPKAAPPAQPPPAQPGTSTAQPAQPQPTPSTSRPSTAASTTKAYLKHANPSQGMTEILIQQALSQFGPMTSVTIDPRKGTAIAVFKDGEGLKKAIEAKRVTVAQGAIEVMEFRDRGGGGGGGGAISRGGFGGRGNRGGRGGRGGGTIGSGGQAQGQAPAAPAAPS